MSEIDISRIVREIRGIEIYLDEHGVKANYVDILEAALTLANRMGAGKWSFVCELRHRREEK